MDLHLYSCCHGSEEHGHILSCIYGVRLLPDTAPTLRKLPMQKLQIRLHMVATLFDISENDVKEHFDVLRQFLLGLPIVQENGIADVEYTITEVDDEIDYCGAV